jgi:predicted transposase YdaD
MKKAPQDKSYDDAFKMLAEQDAEALLLLIGEIVPGEQVEITPLPRELRVSTKLPDQAYRVVSTKGERIIHIEAESWYKNIMPGRMADYGAREWMKYRLPVSCYVLLLTDRGLPKHPTKLGRIDAGDVQITVHYQIIRLSQMLASNALKLKRAHLLPFIPLMQAEKGDLEASVKRLKRVADERNRNDLSFYFLVLGGLRYNPEALLDLLGRDRMIPLEKLKDSSFYQYFAQEARAEVQLEFAQDMLRQHIARRFPTAKVAKKIAQLHDVAALQQLCLEFSEIQDSVALRKRLDEAIKAQKS